MDKGIRYTLRELMIHPGKMQLSYLEGNRINHQKPFAMYFVSATVLGLTLYWLNLLLQTYYHAGDPGEAFFFNKYMVGFLLLAIPFSALVTWSFFYSSGYNFSEIGVFQLYTTSMFFLIVIVCNLPKLIWHQFETRYIELPAVLIYNVITYVNFFPGPKWKIIIKSILCAAIVFLTLAFMQDYLVEYYSNRKH
ncbi:hypothetical protein WSM22_33750 [Cytophagales bacterium WSM2-2]|nr:hypothetical protein WSM22_33750 [Cytophagales bacterium WSM2-2]